jgi:hypothetical protein
MVGTSSGEAVAEGKVNALVLLVNEISSVVIVVIILCCVVAVSSSSIYQALPIHFTYFYQNYTSFPTENFFSSSTKLYSLFVLHDEAKI